MQNSKETVNQPLTDAQRSIIDSFPYMPGAKAKARGVGRDASDERIMLVYLDKRPSDDDLRRFHDALRAV